ncbi:hypothetical protein MMC12_000365 [Toensbergia leucococca]|nr:hypothetical protein [Toensbergia leucococca]
MSTFPFLRPREEVANKEESSKHLTNLENGEYDLVLTSTLAQKLLGHEDDATIRPALLQSCEEDWSACISRRVPLCLGDGASTTEEDLVIVALAALNAFLQSNVTGPPLQWLSTNIVYPKELCENPQKLETLRSQLIASLTADGEAVYRLTPHVELFCLARCLLNHPLIVKEDSITRWARLQINFWHQRLLSDNAASLQEKIYNDLEYLDRILLNQKTTYSKEARIRFLLERAAIHTHHGFDAKAREDLTSAARERKFEFALTGRLGKRTKYQEKELSQLVVLAKSEEERSATQNTAKIEDANGIAKSSSVESSANPTKPQNLDLNDDTLLESISFSKSLSATPIVLREQNLPPALASLDPADQPTLSPLDSIILLALASSITNTSPQDGLTREETLPYATRVLEGGSTNWQIYTQALLVRSRIEGYRSRTVERGVLQLQALVDQVIAETTNSQLLTESSDGVKDSNKALPSTFLPLSKPSESAPVSERLEYIHQLASSTRWILEAELAARWVSLGGLRTALEIYERLEMWAEAALCWAAVDREDKARRIIRRQLFESTSVDGEITVSPSIVSADDEDNENEEYLGEELSALPADAPRLFCILGDIDNSPSLYDRAWDVSKNHYARAQRSLGKYHLLNRDLSKANEAYTKSLKIHPLDPKTWFALGCVRLELQDWRGAVDAFGRTVQNEESDAEAWSNLAAALLRLPSSVTLGSSDIPSSDLDHQQEDLMDEEGVILKKVDSQKHVREAFVALKRAAALKRDSYRIWQNLLGVSATLSPPPYSDIIIAQSRIIELRSNVEGEGCIDIEIVEGLVRHFIASSPDASVGEDITPRHEGAGEGPGRRRLGLERTVVDLVRNKISPLITSSRRLWLLVAKLDLYLQRPLATLEAYEKAWRVTLNQPGWEKGSQEAEKVWKDVMDATIELADAYESLGERKREKGMGEGELVCKSWKFKARSAIGGVLGRGREAWEGSEGWEILEGRSRELRR